MKTKLLPVLLAVLLAGPVAWPREDNKERTPNIFGTWKIVDGEKAGEKVPAEKIERTTVRITKDRITVVDGKDREVYKITYEIDFAKRPHPIKMKITEGPGKDLTARGIIQLQDDTLKLCYAPVGDKAPTEFATKKGVNQLLFVMKRMK